MTPADAVLKTHTHIHLQGRFQTSDIMKYLYTISFAIRGSNFRSSVHDLAILNQRQTYFPHVCQYWPASTNNQMFINIPITFAMPNHCFIGVLPVFIVDTDLITLMIIHSPKDLSNSHRLDPEHANYTKNTLCCMTCACICTQTKINHGEFSDHGAYIGYIYIYMYSTYNIWIVSRNESSTAQRPDSPSSLQCDVAHTTRVCQVTMKAQTIETYNPSAVALRSASRCRDHDLILMIMIMIMNFMKGQLIQNSRSNSGSWLASHFHYDSPGMGKHGQVIGLYRRGGSVALELCVVRVHGSVTNLVLVVVRRVGRDPQIQPPLFAVDVVLGWWRVVVDEHKSSCKRKHTLSFAKVTDTGLLLMYLDMMFVISRKCGHFLPPRPPLPSPL